MQDKLLTAKKILLGLWILMVIAMGASLFPTEASHSLLEICKIILPLIAIPTIVYLF